MAFTIAEPCINTKDSACVNVCPVDCIHLRKDEEGFSGVFQLYIDPDTCIDCGACVPECPVTAIFPNDDVPEGWRDYIDKNADWFKLGRDDFEAKWRAVEEETYVTKARAEGVKAEGMVDTLDYAGYELEVPAEEAAPVAFVIAEPCIGTKDAGCVNVCPVDCIHPRKDEMQFDEVIQLYIDPDTCIDCGACVPECPVTAIFPLEDVPENWRDYIDKNADWFKLAAEDFQAKWGDPGKTE